MNNKTTQVLYIVIKSLKYHIIQQYYITIHKYTNKYTSIHITVWHKLVNDIYYNIGHTIVNLTSLKKYRRN